jgi:type IV pilus assembly protein PilC
MKFHVTIRKEDNSEETMVIEAENRFKVYEEVRGKGGTVTAIKEVSPWWGGGVKSFNVNIIGSGVKAAQVMRMTKNLSAMLSAGLPLSRALSVMERQSRGRFKDVMHRILDEIAKGQSFHAALATFPDIFSSLLIAMVKAGEESGSLADSLAIVGTQMEQSMELTRKIRGAMIYPAIVLTAILIVAVLMLIFVVPTLTKTFKDLKVPVPLATQIIASLSDFMAANAILVLAGLVAFIFGVILFVRSKPGKSILLRIALYLPVIGELARETFAARAARTLSSLLSSGVPLLNGLAITEEVVGAPQFAVVIAEAKEKVRKGEPLSTSFAEHPKLYPLLMSDMLSVGEETGKMSEMLQQVAIFYETDISQRTKDLSTIIEPMLMLLVGAMVGVFAVAMIAPIYSISNAI